MIFRASGDVDGRRRGKDQKWQLWVFLCKYKCNYGSVNWFDSGEKAANLSRLSLQEKKKKTKHKAVDVWHLKMCVYL